MSRGGGGWGGLNVIELYVTKLALSAFAMRVARNWVWGTAAEYGIEGIG